jgi:hypothetical protein
MRSFLTSVSANELVAFWITSNAKSDSEEVCWVGPTVSSRLSAYRGLSQMGFKDLASVKMFFCICLLTSG